jgi:hypothetical protein
VVPLILESYHELMRPEHTQGMTHMVYQPLSTILDLVVSMQEVNVLFDDRLWISSAEISAKRTTIRGTTHSSWYRKDEISFCSLTILGSRSGRVEQVSWVSIVVWECVERIGKRSGKRKVVTSNQSRQISRCQDWITGTCISFLTRSLNGKRPS